MTISQAGMTDPKADKSGGDPGPLRHLASINAYCQDNVAGFEDFISIRAIGDGFSNPTFRVETASGTCQVLRAMPKCRSAASAHRIDREYRVITALRPSLVPVPRPIHFCSDPGPFGTPFYLMEFVPGPVFGNGKLPASLSARHAIYLALAECMGRLHAADYRALGLSNFGTGAKGDHFERQLASMVRLYRGTEMEPLPEMEALIACLERMSQRPPETCLIHGDFRLGNVVIDPSRNGVAAVLDWELSTLGHPLSDVGYCTLMYHWKSEVFGTVIGIEGVPEQGEFLETYCRFAGRTSLPNLGYYQAFSLFRLACMTQAARHREATGSNMHRSLPPGHEPWTMARLALDLAETGDA